MNAKQRRTKRRVVAPAVEALANGLDEAAKTGEPMYPEEMQRLANGLRELVRGNRNWLRVVNASNANAG